LTQQASLGPADQTAAFQALEAAAASIFEGPQASDATLKKGYWTKALAGALSAAFKGADAVQSNVPVVPRDDHGEVLLSAGGHSADIIIRLAPPLQNTRLLIEVKRLARWDRASQAHIQSVALTQRHGLWYTMQMAAVGRHPARTAEALALVNFPLEGGAVQVERVPLVSAEPEPPRTGRKIGRGAKLAAAAAAAADSARKPPSSARPSAPAPAPAAARDDSDEEDSAPPAPTAPPLSGKKRERQK
jgi:hypothetical protein